MTRWMSVLGTITSCFAVSTITLYLMTYKPYNIVLPDDMKDVERDLERSMRDFKSNKR